MERPVVIPDPKCRVVISRSPGRDASRRRFEDAVITGLRRSRSAFRAILVTHVYYLRPADRAAKVLCGQPGPVLAVSWLHPRATRWVMAALGCPPDRVQAIGFRDYRQPQKCVEAIEGMVRKTTRRSKTNAAAGDALVGRQAPTRAVEEFKGPGRHRWYPVIDYERCANCMRCRDFCLFGVYSLDDAGRVVARRPDACKDGCPACARLCPAGAIMFPHYEDDPRIAGAEVAAPPSRGGKAGVARPSAVMWPLPSARAMGPHRRRRKAVRGGPRRRAKKDGLDALMDELERIDEEQE